MKPRPAHLVEVPITDHSTRGQVLKSAIKSVELPSNRSIVIDQVPKQQNKLEQVDIEPIITQSNNQQTNERSNEPANPSTTTELLSSTPSPPSSLDQPVSSIPPQSAENELFQEIAPLPPEDEEPEPPDAFTLDDEPIINNDAEPSLESEVEPNVECINEQTIKEPVIPLNTKPDTKSKQNKPIKSKTKKATDQRSQSILDRAKGANRQRTLSQCDKEERKAKDHAQVTTVKQNRMMPTSTITRSGRTSKKPAPFIP